MNGLGEAAQWEVGNRGSTTELKLHFLINSCIAASCLPQESDHTPESGALYTVDLWHSQMVMVSECVCVLMDFEFCLFWFVCLHLFHSDTHQ